VILELSINRRILIPRAIEFASHFNEQPRKSIAGELVCLARVVKRDNGREGRDTEIERERKREENGINPT